MDELLLKDEVYKIVGACFEVYNELGSGFLEAVYQECLAIEFEGRQIPAASQVPLKIRYKGRALQKVYVADFVCFGAVLVEIKSSSGLTRIDEAQLLNYLKATGIRVGLLINFGNQNDLEWKRLVR